MPTTATADFTIFFLGAEQRGWRDLLVEQGASGMGTTFSSLQRRMPKKKTYRMAEHFPSAVPVLLDAGGHAANRQPGRKTVAEWKTYAEEYTLFVEANIDALTVVTDFDCLALGTDWIHQQRESFYDHLPREKFAPVWHNEWGLTELDRLAETYQRVAIPETAFETGRNITPHINNLVSRLGVKVHGLAATKTDEMRAVHFESVSSTSWLSPMQYGDTIVWDGSRLRRYPVAYKEQARKRHRMLFERAGFNADAILNDDHMEVARFTLWSWMQFEDYLCRRRGSGAPFSNDGADDAPDEPLSDLADDPEHTPINSDDTSINSEIVERGTARVDRRGTEMRNTAQLIARPTDERMLLPVLRSEDITRTEVDPETEQERTVVVGQRTSIQTQSLRHCDNCYIAEKCPARKEHSTCAYDIPVSVSTKEDRAALLDGLIALQGQRVLEMRLIEQLEGGYADPNLSNEVDRLQRLITAKEELGNDVFRMQVEARAGNGAISRIFGGMVDTAPLHQLPPAEQMGEGQTNRVLEGQLVD